MNLSALLRNQVGRPLLGKGRFSLTFQDSPGVIRAVQSLEPLHYSDGSEMKDIDTAWVQEGAQAVIRDAAFNATASLDLQAPEVLSIASEGLAIGFKPLPLYYANAASSLLLPNTMQRLARPQAVTASLQGDTLAWDGAYGPGTVLEWRATPTGVQKWLTIDAPGRFPASLLSNPYLAFGFALTMPGLRAALKSGLVDLTNIETDELFVRLVGADDIPVLALQRPVATDAAGERVQGKLKFQRFGTTIVVAAGFPVSWLTHPDRVYPLRIDPTVTTQQSDAANDGWVSTNSYNGSTIFVGTRATTDIDYQGFIRWPQSPVPKGATIVSDTVTLNQGGSNSSAIDIAIEYEAADNAAQIIDRPGFLARARTPVAAVWPVSTSLTTKTTPNLKSGLQAVVNRPGYAVGNAVQMFLRDNVANNTVVNRVRFNTAEAGAAYYPIRETIYSEPVASGGAGDVTVFLRPRDLTDDGYSYSPDGFNRTSSNIVGDISFDHYDYRSFIRCTLDPGKQLPQGATLVKAEFVMVANGGSRNNNDPFKFSLQPADNPTAPTTKSDHDGRTRGTQVIYNVSLWQGTEQTEYVVDITSIVQTIVNRPGYNSGAMLVLADGAGGGWGTVNNNAQFHSFDTDPAKAPFIRVTYRDPNPPVVESIVMAR